MPPVPKGEERIPLLGWCQPSQDVVLSVSDAGHGPNKLDRRRSPLVGLRGTTVYSMLARNKSLCPQVGLSASQQLYSSRSGARLG